MIKIVKNLTEEIKHIDQVVNTTGGFRYYAARHKESGEKYLMVYESTAESYNTGYIFRSCINAGGSAGFHKTPKDCIISSMPYLDIYEFKTMLECAKFIVDINS